MGSKENDTSFSARELILTLIDSAASQSLTARYFVAAGDIFGIDSGSIRVALGRLVRDGALRQVERGVYALGTRGGTLHRMVRSWWQVESSVKPWTGAWLAVMSAHLPRSDRRIQRRRERALGLFGFAPARTGLWLRPENLTISIQELHNALLDLGLDDEALVFSMRDLHPADAVDVKALWDRKAIEKKYKRHIKALADSTKRLPDYSDEEAAREVLLLGREVTRDILLDPLLPESLIDTGLRQQMVNDMGDYDRLGKPFWRELYQRYN